MTNTSYEYGGCKQYHVSAIGKWLDGAVEGQDSDPGAAKAGVRDVEGRDQIMAMSDWSQVTRPIPVPNEWTKPFWDAAKRGVLELQRCQACRRFQHPPYPTCVNCMAIDLAFEPVSGKGAIYTYTIMYHAGDKRFAAAVPYASIIVELDDAPGALLAANLLEAPYTEAKVGRRVEGVFEPLNDDITLPQFRLARDKQ